MFSTKRENFSTCGSAEIFTWHICRSLSNILAWFSLVRLRGKEGSELIQGKVSQRGGTSVFPQGGRGGHLWGVGTESQNGSDRSCNVCTAAFPGKHSSRHCWAGTLCAGIAYPMSNSKICIISGLLFPLRQEALCSRVSCSAFRAEA